MRKILLKKKKTIMSIIETTQINVSEKMIDFGIGQPDPDLLPLEIMQQAVNNHFETNDSPSFLAYGAEQGSQPFRNLLAEFLSKHYQTPVLSEHLFVTNGNSQGLHLICTLFCQTGDTIFVEDPTYNLALSIFADFHLRVVGIPIDNEGIIIEALEEKLLHHKPVFLYTIPTFHNPTGVTLSAKRREKLVELSQKKDFLIVADEVYHLLPFSGIPPAPLGSYISSNTILSLGTFSKILAPGLRLGWIQTGSTLMKLLIRAGMLNSGGGLNPFTSSIVCKVIELGLLDKHLGYLKKVYQQRSKILMVTLRKYLPDLMLIDEPEGGFFFWLRLPDKIDTKGLSIILQQEDVNFKPGVDFSCAQGSGNYARLCFAFYNEEKLVTGVKRLAVAISKVISLS
jgi:2-aminoadipate transaminase